MKKILFAFTLCLAGMSQTLLAETRSVELGNGSTINIDFENRDEDEGYTIYVVPEAVSVRRESRFMAYQPQRPDSGVVAKIYGTRCGSRPKGEGFEVTPNVCNAEFIASCTKGFDCMDPIELNQCGYGECKK